MTFDFQPLDFTIFYCCKSFLRNKAQTWHSEEVQKSIIHGVNSDKNIDDLCISTLKSSHPIWVTQYQNHIQVKEIILGSWKKSGINGIN